jgi:hypothetical protein
VTKLFTFSADSFTLSPDLEALLRTKEAVYMDFGNSAYVRSNLIPSILSDLISSAGTTLAKNQPIFIQAVEGELAGKNSTSQGGVSKTESSQSGTVLQASDSSLRESYQRLQNEFQALRSQNIDTLASLKVLEDENEEIRIELDGLKAHAKPVESRV